MNECLVRDVFAELAEGNPDGLQYAGRRLDDGVSFRRLAVLDGELNPLQASAAVGRFQSGLRRGCVEGLSPRRRNGHPFLLAASRMTYGETRSRSRFLRCPRTPARDSGQDVPIETLRSTQAYVPMEL